MNREVYYSRIVTTSQVIINRQVITPHFNFLHPNRSLPALFQHSHTLSPFQPPPPPDSRANLLPAQIAKQVPEVCVCGGPTSTVWAPTTVVVLPSTPNKVQVAPPSERMWETLRGSSARGFQIQTCMISIPAGETCLWGLGRER